MEIGPANHGEDQDGGDEGTARVSRLGLTRRPMETKTENVRKEASLASGLAMVFALSSGHLFSNQYDTLADAKKRR